MEEEKRLVLFAPVWRFRMNNGKTTKEINPNRDTIEDVLKLWEKGYSLEKEKQIEEVNTASKFSEILQEIAEALQPTNAQKAAYFRDVKPYQYGQLLAVEFPTACNLVKNTAEEFKQVGKPYQIRTFFHGTKVRLIPSIMLRGLKRSKSGMLGPGIYVGPLDKAQNYTDLVILEVKVILGNCKELKKVETLHENPDFDSLHAPAGPLDGVYKKFLNHEEWIVRYPKQVEVSKLVCWRG